MLYWIIYDISDNNIRNRISNKCKDYGFVRVQKSSFLGNTSKNKIEMLSIEFKEILNGSDDCIFIFPTCKSCFSEKIIHGRFNESAVKNKDFLIINGEKYAETIFDCN